MVVNVKILATGSSGNCVLLENKILIDAGITFKLFKSFNVTPEVLFITHKHSDHMQLPLVRKLLKAGVKSYFPTDVIAEIAKENKINIQAYPYLGLIPGICICLTVMAVNFIGDGLRDALDPKLRR